MSGHDQDATNDVTVDRDLVMVTRDGVVLRADVYRSERARREDLLEPVILVRTPYGKHWYTELGRMYALRGYLAVFQDVRGQHASEGEWTPFVHEADDGEDTVAWLRTLPSSSGSFALIGSSYLAFCAWQIAIRRPQGLGAIVSAMTPFDVLTDWVRPGGALALAFSASWALNNVAQTSVASLEDGDALAGEMARLYAGAADAARGREAEPGGPMAGGVSDPLSHLPIAELPGLQPHRPEVAGWFFDWLRSLEGGSATQSAWDPFDLTGQLADLDVPVLHVGGWYDVFVRGAVRGFDETKGDPRSRLLLGPWSHNTWTAAQAERDFGDGADLAFQREALAWTDRWLGAGNQDPGEEARVRWFAMGADTWRAADSWPPPIHEVRMALTPDGRLVTGPSEPGSVRQTIDPREPTPAVGGQSCCYPPVSPMGPRDQRAVEDREDVLSFTSEPLAEPLEIAGEVVVEVALASSTIATDVVVTLVDVAPGGAAYNLTEGIVRIGTPGAEEPPLQPGETRIVRVALHPTANVFAQAHRIRLDLAGSKFPTYDRNPQSGVASWRASDADLVVAEREIQCGGLLPSVLVLPTLCTAGG